MANQFLEWLWRVLAAVCVLLERERERGRRRYLLLRGQGRKRAGARGWSMEMNGLLFKVGVAQ